MRVNIDVYGVTPNQHAKSDKWASVVVADKRGNEATLWVDPEMLSPFVAALLAEDARVNGGPTRWCVPCAHEAHAVCELEHHDVRTITQVPA